MAVADIAADIAAAEAARISALDLLGCYLRSGKGRDLVERVSASDRHKHSEVFEYCVAYELGHIVWKCLPPASFERGGVAMTRLGRRAEKPL